MTASINTRQMVRLLEKVARDIESAQAHLTQLDAAMGDGDHGVSMTIGSRAVRKALATTSACSVPDLLQQAANTFQAAAGATVGALLGAGVRAAASTLASKDQLGPEDLSRSFRAALDAVMKLGGAEPGDKTMVDCLHPATVATEKAVLEGKDAFTALRCGLEAAEQGMESTRMLVARKGRASRLGERTRGHVDPGAASCFLMLQSAVDFLEQERSMSATPSTERVAPHQL